MSQRNQSLALVMIRTAAAGNMLIHGITRISIRGVAPFDEFLGALGFPPFTAWVITLFEIVASVAIIAGKWVALLSIVFCLELLMGVILVHWPEGWFVVGAGRNGMEYSVLMIICFASIALSYQKSNP